MHRLRGIEVWILLSLLPWRWAMSTTPASGVISSKKGIVTSKQQYFSFPALAEIVRSDMKKMQATLDRMVDGLEKLENRWSRRNDGSDGSFESNVFGNVTNHLSMKILSEKLDRISRTQARNSRLINVQMESLMKLEEDYYSFANLQRQKAIPDDVASLPFTLYQRQVVERLTSIDNKLDRLPRIEIDGSTARDGDNEANDRNRTLQIGATFDNGYNESSPNYTSTMNISVPSCEALEDTGLPSGVYNVDRRMAFIWGNTTAIFCDTTTNDGSWTVIQKRGPTLGEATNFTRSWNDYADGFGNIVDEFWLGNEIVHRMTFYNGPHELRIELEDWDGERAWAQYSYFELGPKEDNYRIKVAGYTGNATDSLSAHDSTLFSTFDRRNDLAPRCCPCTSDYGGGWWYYSCFEANLNGDYYKKDQYRQPFRGIIWEHWRGNYSLKTTMMKIRSRSSNVKRQMKRNY